ncbi:MAG: hypothetical protein ACE37H_08430 [Phycisphaeraceae bacterium]
MKYNAVRRRPDTTRHALAVILYTLIAAGPALLVAPRVAAEQRKAPEHRPITLTLPIAGERVTGTIDRYDTLTFTLKTDAGDEHRVLWNAIPAANVDRYWRHMEQPDADAEALFELGDLLIRHREGKALAERAFDQALALDPQLKDAIDQSRQGIAPDGSPRYVGVADPAMWGELTHEQMSRGVESLRAFCTKTQKALELDLSLYEAERFMLLTDVNDPEQIKSLSIKLVETYRATAELLGDDPDGNVFLGKCLVVLFSKRVDYIRFQQTMHDTDARGTGGLCHGFGDGHAHVAAFRRNNPRQTNHVVCHELVHAYLHRYRTPVPIDDWLNEGLAEHLAREVEPPPGNNLYVKSRLALEGRQGLGEGFFTTDRLDRWQYDVAGALTGYLLERGEHAYPKLIQSIKAGTPTIEALEQVYRMDERELTQRFKRRLDRELNRKLGGE